MTAPKITTHEMEPFGFQEGVFFSGADLLSPVIIFPEHLQMSGECQSLSEVCDLQAKLIRLWWFVATISAGQFSLLKDTSVYVLARLDIVLRLATNDEAQIDFCELGDQVTGNEVSDQEIAEGPSFLLLGKRHHYMGPLRLVKGVFSARVVQGSPTADQITSIATEIDSLRRTDFSEREGCETRRDALVLFVADKGALKCAVFSGVNEFAVESLIPLGKLTFTNTVLLFTPEDKEAQALDLTDNLFRQALSSPRCIGCGCTEERACVGSLGPCHWLKVDYVKGIGVCSECSSCLPNFDKPESDPVDESERSMEPRFEVTWEPLKNLIEEEDCRHFMFMANYTNSRGMEIFTYKHIATRSYINVDKEGRFYRYVPTVPDYVEVSVADALQPFIADGVSLRFKKASHLP